MPSQGTSTFELFALRFHFLAPVPAHFPEGETANLFRGQLGKILYRRDPAAYARFFSPVRDAGVPSGLHDLPRPFVLRVRHLEGTTLDRFHVGLNLFETNHRAIVDAMAELGRESFRAELVRVEGQDVLRFPLAATVPARRVRVHFLSPTELKNARRPEFGPLFSRIRDRIGTLRALYGSGPLEIDFKAMGERAMAIQMTRCDIRHVEVERSTGQRHPLGGFTGIAEYEGDLTEFIPYLEIAGYTGVGRQTVWGNGEISIETF
ncbi:MAG: CRISPR system precrRNA processing endoribonuclease RAMP protein Cas6 [Bryobacteraceae bacterium]